MFANICAFTLGNCWFLASVGALTFQDDVMDQVMPVDQSFVEDYAGIFRFRVSYLVFFKITSEIKWSVLKPSALFI